MKKLLLLATFIFFISTNVKANLIFEEYTLIPGTTQIEYYTFEVTQAGTFTLDVFGSSTLDSDYNSDTYLHLFANVLSAATFLELDDDSGFGVDAQIVRLLDIGTYIMAAFDCCNSSVEDVVNGIGGLVETPGGLIRVQVASDDGTANAVSEVSAPSVFAILSLGIFALFARRKANQ